MAVIALPPTEPSTRRWSDPEVVTKHTRSFEMTYWAVLAGFLFAGLAQGASAYTTSQHTSELARQAQNEATNAALTKRVCEMYEHRDAAALKIDAKILRINAAYAKHLPAGYAAALDGIVATRDADLFSIEKLDCNATPPSPAPSTIFTP